MLNCLVVTPCGAKKDTEPSVARSLYKSTRIRAVYARRNNCSMGILSAKFGLVDTETVLVPYEQVMDSSRVAELLPQVCKFISAGNYDVVVFFRGGTNDNYLKLMKNAACTMGVTLVYFGHPSKDNFHVALLPEIIKLAELGMFVPIQMICPSAFVYAPGSN